MHRSMPFEFSAFLQVPAAAAQWRQRGHCIKVQRAQDDTLSLVLEQPFKDTTGAFGCCACSCARVCMCWRGSAALPVLQLAVVRCIASVLPRCDAAFTDTPNEETGWSPQRASQFGADAVKALLDTVPVLLRERGTKGQQQGVAV